MKLIHFSRIWLQGRLFTIFVLTLLPALSSGFNFLGDTGNINTDFRQWYDCTLATTPEGATRSDGWCPAEYRCLSANCIPQFGENMSPGFRDWGTYELDQLDQPVDLAFYPRASGQLWILNQGSNSVTIQYCPGAKNQVYSENRRDLAACHFMQAPTSLSFGNAPGEGDAPNYSGQQARYLDEAGTVLTTGNSCNPYDAAGLSADHAGLRYCSDFMGPTLWEASQKSFAIANNDIFPADVSPRGVPQGSHIDMLHQSPYSMGSVWSGNNATYWVWDAGPDSRFGSITRLQIDQSHGYGGYNHNAASMYRYDGLVLQRPARGIPGHMALWGKWLYLADPSGGRIIRLDTTTGDLAESVKPEQQWREHYRNYRRVMNATIEVLNVPDLVLKTPSGLHAANNTLFISDWETNRIHAVTLNQSHTGHQLLGSIQTPAQGITGITVDEVDRLWFVDSETNTLWVTEPECTSAEACEEGISAWDSQCSPELNNQGKPYFQAFREQTDNDNNWQGCARHYYQSCPGGNPLVHSNLTVCEAVGGNYTSARVTWEANGSSDCSCASPETSGQPRTTVSRYIDMLLGLGASLLIKAASGI